MSTNPDEEQLNALMNSIMGAATDAVAAEQIATTFWTILGACMEKGFTREEAFAIVLKMAPQA